LSSPGLWPGEYLGASAGLGYRIAQAEGVFDVVGVFSGMLVLTAFVVLIDAVVSVIERRLLVWRPESAAGGSAQG
jgi:NitT/TauT family transport system permease protein